MPKKKPAELVWLAPLGRTLYETLNPFWAFCEAGGGPVVRVALLFDEELDRDAQAVVAGFGAVGKAFLSAEPEIQPIPFNDEDVRAFRKQMEAVFAQAAAENRKIVADISPTTLNYVPVLIMEMVRNHRKAVAEVRYMQYDDRGRREIPYPLIPRQCVIRHDLLKEIEIRRRGA